MSDRFSLKSLSSIFNPLIPGFIIAGISSGLCSLVEEFIPLYRENAILYILFLLFDTMAKAFNAYLPAWIGLSASKVFGVEPICGALLGMLTTHKGIDLISSASGLADIQLFPGISILQSGGGGVLAVLFGMVMLSYAEKMMRRIVPKSIDSIVTPLFSMVITIIPYVFLIMPFFGVVSNLLCLGLEKIIFNERMVVKLIAGFISASLFLPINLMGMQFAFIALYAMQLESVGSISLYPVLAMAGASQVGAGLSVALKARMNQDNELMGVALTGIVPGMLGIGSPLLYGVSIPHIKVFLTSCFGAGFGGAYIIASGVSSTGWGASGLLAIPLMTAGVNSPLMNMVNYVIGLLISMASGFVITTLLVKKSYLMNK